ncbi:MAG TPA: polysaccharide deacetylase family protein [Fimbriimonadaceae bacterium]
MTTRKAVLLSIGAIVLIAGGWKLNKVRLEVGGIRNMLSLSYWRARINHTDLYAPNAHMLKHGNHDLHEIAITIDDGPHPQSCGPILDVLKREGVHATFFPVGVRMKQSPELIRRMVAEGNEVGNHTEDHLRLTTLRPDQMEKEIKFCAQNFYKITGRQMYIMRPPGMNIDENVIKLVKSMDYIMVNWTSAAKDFISLKQTKEIAPEVIADRVVGEADNGGIILIHDAPDTAHALPLIIDRLKAQGYKFVTISEMMAHLPDPVHIKTNAGPYPPGYKFTPFTAAPINPPKKVAMKPATKSATAKPIVR